MIGSPKYSVLSRVGIVGSFALASQAATIGTVQASLGFDCSKAFMAAAVTGLTGLVVWANARCYPKLSDKRPWLLGEVPCELSWIQKGSHSI